MNRKLRVFMLSVAVVLFAVASAFALVVDDVEIVADEEGNTSDFVEGYNVKLKYTASLTEYSGEGTDTRKLENVVWEFYPVNSADTWLKPTYDPNNRNVIYLQGRVPAVNADETANKHFFYVAARVSGDLVSVDAQGEEITQTIGDEEVTVMYSGDIVVYAGEDTLDDQEEEYPTYVLIEPTEGDVPLASVDVFPDMVSIDETGANNDKSKARSDYSVTINFPTTTAVTIAEEEDDSGTRITVTSGEVFVNAAMEYAADDIATFEESLNLPSWLSYDVTTQYAGAYEEGESGALEYTEDDSTAYVKTLRIFYKSDIEPADGTPASVRITVAPSSTASVTDEAHEEGAADYQGTQSFAEIHGDTAIIGWDLEYSAIPAVALETKSFPESFTYGKITSFDVYYRNQYPEKISFDPDISQNVVLTVGNIVKISEDENNEYGYFTVSADPKTIANAKYSTNLVVTDKNGQTAALLLNISVDVPVIRLSYDYRGQTHPTLSTAPFDTDYPDWYTEWYNVKPVSIDLSQITPGLKPDVVSLDETEDGESVKHGRIVFTYSPTVAGSWDGIIKVYDEYGGSADIMLSLRTEVTSEPMTTTAAVSGDESASPSVYTGNAATLLLTAKNAYGTIRWVIDNLADLTARGINLTQLSATGNTAVYNFLAPLGTTPGNYTVNISATDSLDRKAAAYNFTVSVKAAPITISGDFASIDVVYPASGEATVEYSNAEFTKWEMSPDISADISFDIASTPADSTSIEGKITVTATPLTASNNTYTTTIYFYDSYDNYDSRDITVTVTLPALTVSSDTVTLSAAAGSTVSEEVSYTGVQIASCTASPDIPDIFGFSVESDDSAVTFTAAPTAPGTYTGTLTLVDIYGTSADIALTISATQGGNVPPAPGAFAVSPTSAAANVTIGGASQNVSFTASNNSGDVTWTLGTLPTGVTITPATQTGTTARYTVTTGSTAAAGTNSVTVTARDAAGHSATATISVTVAAPGAFAVSPTSAAANVTIGGASQNVSFTASNNSGDVTWTLGTLPTGVTVTPATQTGTTARYTVTAGSTAAAGTNSVTVTARDAAGHSATATISVTVAAVGTLAVSPSAPSVSIRAGNSQNVSLTASGNSGTVTWTLGTVPSGVTVAPATGSGYATQGNTVMIYTVTGSTSGTYSVTVTATDAAGRSATVTISISVTSTPQPPEPEEQSEETQQLVDIYKSVGALNSDGTVPDSALTYTTDNPSAHTLSKAGTNQVTRGSSINPVKLVLDFPVDIWKIYINGVLAAWAYSPSVNATDANDFMTFYTAEGSQGIDIIADSNTEATITFDTNTMPSGSNEVVAAFVPDATQPAQEIGRTALATVNVSGSSTTSGDIGVGSSSGGCSAGFGALVSALAAAFFISRKRS